MTELIKGVLKDDYNYDSTVCHSLVCLHRYFHKPAILQNSFRALYRTFSQCCFVEDDGDIVFYKNKDGKSVRVLECDVVKGEQIREPFLRFDMPPPHAIFEAPC